jgi:hypothetical protein
MVSTGVMAEKYHREPPLSVRQKVCREQVQGFYNAENISLT